MPCWKDRLLERMEKMFQKWESSGKEANPKIELDKAAPSELLNFGLVPTPLGESVVGSRREVGSRGRKSISGTRF